MCAPACVYSGRSAGVHVTPEACEALSKMLARRSEEGRCLRLSTQNGSYRFVLDEPIEQDVIFYYEEQTVLVISETISRDLWGITIDCADDRGRKKLVFRKARGSEPLDTAKAEEDSIPPAWKASEHERLLGEIAEIGQRIATLRGGSKSHLREQLQTLEASKQQKWDAIRSLWAGDGQSHRRNGIFPGKPAE